jgi:hypothetical protein
MYIDVIRMYASRTGIFLVGVSVEMAFPRLYAAVAVVLLIGALSLAGIVAVMTIGPKLAHGSSVQHVSGKVVSITGPDRDFTFRTAKGELLKFQCRNACRASSGHLQRHINEKANTDVYYQQGPGNTLLVIDVD